MNERVIELKALSRRFGKLIAVDSISISVNAGEVFGLLGSNGAGKSTTIKMLTTLLPPSSGDALVAGLSVKTRSVGVRRAIGYVPQAVSVDGSLTGYENLLIFAKLYDIPGREREERIRETLDYMGLSGDGRRLVSEYSGGMVRRLEIALSTLHRPKVLFLDEPTVGLDPIARDAVKTREQFMGVGQLLTMPLFFASNAIYPTAMMPDWLKVVSHCNPLTYVVDALRSSMVVGSENTIGMTTDYAVLTLSTIILVFIAAKLYPRLAI